jgi:hypothetical protein
VAGAKVLTCEHCRTLIERLRRAFGAGGVRIEDLVLWYDLADVRWVAELRGAVLDLWGAAGADRDRATRAAYHATLLDRTAKALEVCSDLPGYRPVARHLKNFRLLPSKGDAARQAADHMYELEVAARLSTSIPGIVLDEPDIRVSDPDLGTFSIACKRPRAIDTVASAADDGIEQIRKMGTCGIVFVCADRIIDPLVRDHSGKGLGPECDRRLQAVVDGCRPDIEAALRRHPIVRDDSGRLPTGVFGVVISGSFALFGRDGPNGEHFINTCPVTRRIPGGGDVNWATRVLLMLQEAHVRGEQMFRGLN